MLLEQPEGIGKKIRKMATIHQEEEEVGKEEAEVVGEATTIATIATTTTIPIAVV